MIKNCLSKISVFSLIFNVGITRRFLIEIFGSKVEGDMKRRFESLRVVLEKQ